MYPTVRLEISAEVPRGSDLLAQKRWPDFDRTSPPVGRYRHLGHPLRIPRYLKKKKMIVMNKRLIQSGGIWFIVINGITRAMGNKNLFDCYNRAPVTVPQPHLFCWQLSNSRSLERKGILTRIRINSRQMYDWHSSTGNFTRYKLIFSVSRPLRISWIVYDSDFPLLMGPKQYRRKLVIP